MEIIASTEQALIGALLLSQKKIIEVLEIVKVEDFSTLAGATAFSLIVDMFQKKRNIDVISTGNGDPKMLVYLSESTSMAYAPAAVEYAHSIAKAAKSRRINDKLAKIQKADLRPDIALRDILDLYQREMSAGRKDPNIVPILNRFEGLVKRNKQNGRMGYKTGFAFLERLYVQYIPGHIWTVGGFTSVGKTAVMIQKICNMIVNEYSPSILVVSTEMTEEQMVSRIIANLTGIHSYRVLSGNYHDEEEQDKVDQWKSVLSAAKLKIYDDIYTLNEIETAFRKADLQGGVDVGFIDYVQNVRVPDAKSQYQEQSEIAKRLQKLAKDVTATVICLSQVSNDVGRGNTDNLELKGAGEWAAVSDVGIMLNRHKTEKHRLKYSIKKNRHGALGEFELEYKAEYTRLAESQGVR